jgi:hypothetical protein
LDAARSISLTRLTAIFGDETAPDEDAPAEQETAVTADGAAPTEGTEPADDLTAVGTEALDEPPSLGTAEIAETVAVADAEARTRPPIVVIGDEDGSEFASVPLDEVDVTIDVEPRGAVDPDGRDLPPVRDELSVRAEMPGAQAPLPTKPIGLATRSLASRAVATRSATTRPRPAGSANRGDLPHSPQPTAGPVAVVASCPYCAVLLDPPPKADRRCVRCRRRIKVKRVQGRAVYLTEAAVEVFEAERRRIANLGRWTRDRRRWLKLAASVEAPAGRIDRLERAAVSDVVVAAARSLYQATVERRVRAARRNRRWDEASRLRLDEALALYRVAGSPLPVPEDVVALHREGALAELRGLGDITKDAALIGAGCCEPCRADDGRSFRISRELREPRLPHPGCPTGLCRCRWDLTTRDRDLVGGYLRRHVRSNRVTPSA